jgi:4,5-dihydroxyphthalate decarboxylase
LPSSRFLQARVYGLPYVLLPATVLGRGQLQTVAYNSERGAMKPSDLNGKRFGVRSYTQTTGIWVRGILAEDYGVDWSKVEITTMRTHTSRSTRTRRSSSARQRANNFRRC